MLTNDEKLKIIEAIGYKFWPTAGNQFYLKCFHSKCEEFLLHEGTQEEILNDFEPCEAEALALPIPSGMRRSVDTWNYNGQQNECVFYAKDEYGIWEPMLSFCDPDLALAVCKAWLRITKIAEHNQEQPHASND